MRVRSQNGMWEILPGQLYQSGNWTDFTVGEKFRRVELRNLTMVINAWKVDPDLKEMFGEGYVHVPFPDGQAALPAEVRQAAELGAAEIKRGGTVLTMCYRGRNRSALLSALIVCEVSNLTGEEAVTLVRLRRPNAMSNPNHPKFVVDTFTPPRTGATIVVSGG